MEAMSRARMFVPSQPTLWPHMLWAPARPAHFPPFAAANVRHAYFARNAVWLAAKLHRLEGREVLVPAYHHGVEVEALVAAGVRPRFYRVGANWDVDVEDIARKVGPETGAIYLTHFAGFPGPTDALRRMADERGIPLFEDCALSLLSSDGTRPLGSTGDVGIFCLYKTLPVPHGGALVLNRDTSRALPELEPPPAASTSSHLLSLLLLNLEMRGGGAGRALRTAIRALGHAAVDAAQIERVATGTQHFELDDVELGMAPVALRLALAQDLDGIVERRRRNFFQLLGRLRDVGQPMFHELPAGICPLFFPIRVQDKSGVLARLRTAGIDAVDFWSDFHPSCAAADFPEVAALRREIVEIPCHQDLEPDTVSRVAEEVRLAVRSGSARRARVG
jgi:dTDP-4-amino-4,6-dideoxygalactose transaminase